MSYFQNLPVSQYESVSETFDNNLVWLLRFWSICWITRSLAIIILLLILRLFYRICWNLFDASKVNSVRVPLFAPVCIDRSHGVICTTVCSDGPLWNLRMVMLGHNPVRSSRQVYLIEIESDICSIVITTNCVVLLILVVGAADDRDQMAWLVSWGRTSLGFQILCLLSGLSYVVEVLIVLLLASSIVWLLAHGHCEIIRQIGRLPHAFVPQACFTPTFFPRSHWIACTWLHFAFLAHRWLDLPIERIELIWNVMVHLVSHHVLTNDLSTGRVLLWLRTGDQTFDSLVDPILSRITTFGLDSCDDCLILWFGSSCCTGR